MEMTSEDFKKNLKSTYGDDVVLGAKDMQKFSSGVYDLDIALGGGWAFGVFHLVAGGESSGKTTTAIRAAAQVNKIDRETGKFNPDTVNPCGVMYVDQEGTLDLEWAYQIGFNTEYHGNLVAGFTAGEQAADAVNSAICSGVYTLIIIDSLETFLPKARISGENASVEDTDVGGRARILNRGYRLWLASLKEMIAKYQNKPWRIPTIIALNQWREKIGVMYGDPRVLPGGKSQLFYSATFVSMNTPKVQDDTSKTWGIGEFSGIVKKNKTGGVPKKNFTFQMALKDLDELKAGEIANHLSVFSDVKRLNLMEKTDNGYEFMGEKFRVQGDLKERLASDPLFLKKAWELSAEANSK
jgi:RecA/RadA recombinase